VSNDQAESLQPLHATLAFTAQDLLDTSGSLPPVASLSRALQESPGDAKVNRAIPGSTRLFEIDMDVEKELYTSR
jgi:hypothetical protein